MKFNAAYCLILLVSNVFAIDSPDRSVDETSGISIETDVIKHIQENKDFIPPKPETDIMESKVNYIKSVYNDAFQRCKVGAACVFEFVRQQRLDFGPSVMISSISLITIFKEFFNGDEKWAALTRKFSEFDLTVVVSFFLTTTLYWSFGAFLTSLETQSSKLQPNVHISQEQMMECYKTVLFNQVTINSLLGVFYWYLMPKLGWDISQPLPSVTSMLRDSVVYVGMHETLFYFFHRLAHHPKLYKYVHKKHHHFKAPTALAAIYAHPVEHILINLLPVAVGPMFLKSHLTMFWGFTCVAIMTALYSHCGHDIGVFTAPRKHDEHHRDFIHHFGVIGIFDRLLGTDGKEQCPKALDLTGFRQLLEPVPNEETKTLETKDKSSSGPGIPYPKRFRLKHTKTFRLHMKSNILTNPSGPTRKI